MTLSLCAHLIGPAVKPTTISPPKMGRAGWPFVPRRSSQYLMANAHRTNERRKESGVFPDLVRRFCVSMVHVSLAEIIEFQGPRVSTARGGALFENLRLSTECICEEQNTRYRHCTLSPLKTTSSRIVCTDCRFWAFLHFCSPFIFFRIMQMTCAHFPAGT